MEPIKAKRNEKIINSKEKQFMLRKQPLPHVPNLGDDLEPLLPEEDEEPLLGDSGGFHVAVNISIVRHGVANQLLPSNSRNKKRNTHAVLSFFDDFATKVIVPSSIAESSI